MYVTKNSSSRSKFPLKFEKEEEEKVNSKAKEVLISNHLINNLPVVHSTYKHGSQQVKHRKFRFSWKACLDAVSFQFSGKCTFFCIDFFSLQN